MTRSSPQFPLPAICGLPLVLFLAALSGCSTAATTDSRHFVFQQDALAYANELVSEYRFDERGRWTSKPRQPKPDYTHHCFVVARTARQFFGHARFDPTRPVADADTYRRLIREVLSASPREFLAEEDKIVIPGYASVREFSRAEEGLLKRECGGAWQSYFQRGHWRMIWPFTRRHQEAMAEELADDLKRNRPPVVHLARFPSLTINHAVLLFDCEEDENEIRFAAYDPNSPEKPATLTYNRAARRFSWP